MAELASSEVYAPRTIQVWRSLLNWLAFFFQIFTQILPSFAQVLSYVGLGQGSFLAFAAHAPPQFKPLAVVELPKYSEEPEEAPSPPQLTSLAHGGGERTADSTHLEKLTCVIVELILEGQPLFELSQLFAYRRGQFDPTQHLEKIPDSRIRKMILHIIQLDPESRCSAESYLQNNAGVVFPSYFSPFLHNFYSLFNPPSRDARVLACKTSFQEIFNAYSGFYLKGEIDEVRKEWDEFVEDFTS